MTGKCMVTIIIDSVTNGVSRQPGESLESNGEKIMNTSTCVIDNMVRITVIHISVLHVNLDMFVKD